MTNPAAAIKMLITYAICIPIAIFVGYLLTNPLDYGTLGFLGLVIALIISPVFIKWHYPMMVFGMSLPAYLFFLKGNPQAWQVLTLLSLGISIVERAMNAEKRFLKAPAMTWALLFTAGMAVLTMKLTGGFGLHTLGADTGGGKKYINLYLGIATFFALAARGIPPAQRKLYVTLFFISGAFGFISDMFPFLPKPLNYINLLFPPSGFSMADVGTISSSRLGYLANSATAVMIFLVARFGLRGIFSLAHLFRLVLFFGLFIISMMGGFRSGVAGNLLLLGIVFVLEGLYRTKLVAVIAVFVLIAGCLVVPFSRDIPYNIQRALSFLPVDVDPMARSDAEASTEWRQNIWRAVWPTVPSYLLLGKGYALTSLDFESMGTDTAFKLSAQVDASQEGLAISSDYHSGPLSTLICFGAWGGISILALMAGGFYVLYRNFKYGDPDLSTVNALLLAIHLQHIVTFFFVFGGYDGDVGYFARIVGFSVALNWGVRGPRPQAANLQRVKPLQPQPLPRPLPA